MINIINQPKGTKQTTMEYIFGKPVDGEQLFPIETSPIFIPKKRHWADQRRAAKKRRRAK